MKPLAIFLVVDLKDCDIAEKTIHLNQVNHVTGL